MNRKEAAELLPIIQAFSEGRTIERKTRSWELNKGWHDVTQWEETEELICRDTFVYRIKPEPKYRPFKNAEECWTEMEKHSPFGWVKDYNGSKCIIETIYSSDNSIYVSDEGTCSFNEIFEKFKFADGTPFGIKVEE